MDDSKIYYVGKHLRAPDGLPRFDPLTPHQKYEIWHEEVLFDPTRRIVVDIPGNGNELQLRSLDDRIFTNQRELQNLTKAVIEAIPIDLVPPNFREVSYWGVSVLSRYRKPAILYAVELKMTPEDMDRFSSGDMSVDELAEHFLTPKKP